MDWIDKAYTEIEEDYENGYISKEEYQDMLYDLRNEIKEYESHMSERD
jgi:predicted RND superfamily exporter protein